MKWTKIAPKADSTKVVTKYAWYPVCVETRDYGSGQLFKDYVWFEKYVAEYKYQWINDSGTTGWRWVHQRSTPYEAAKLEIEPCNVTNTSSTGGL